MYLLKKRWKLMKIAGPICLLAIFAVLLSCDLNTLSDKSPGQSSDVSVAYLVDSDPIPEYTFKPDEFANPASYSSVYLTPPQPYASPEVDSYGYFFNFRLEKFSPNTEPLIKERFGSRLGIKKAGLWEHNSYNSHAVGFATNLPAISVIEYGETSQYGSHTDVSESYFYNHLHYLKNLKEGTAYHYRVIVMDEDGAIIALPDRTFITKTFTDEVTKLYQGDFTHNDENGVSGSGLWITSPGIYVLMEDISSDGLGINVKSHDVTIDLNGHTLIYDNGANPLNEADGNSQYNEHGSWGIRAGLWNFTSTNIYNGVIKQGKTGSYNRGPLFLHHMGNVTTKNEIAGLTVDYYGDSTPGMYTDISYVHHNLLYDRGNQITDRHMGVRALQAETRGSIETEVAYNSFRRFRQRGIDGARLVHDNELYSDSFATNSFALGVGDNVTVKNNKIFGMGDNPIGIGWGNNIHVADNFIYMWGYSPTKRFDEYARKSSISGMRVTNYDNNVFENMLFEGNTIVLKATDNCFLARGIWTTNGVQDKNILYRHNTVKVEAMPDNLINENSIYYNDEVNNAITAVSVQGGGWVSEEIADALIFEDNRLISNVNHIIIGEGYGISSGVRFYRTAFEKIDHDSDRRYFKPVRLGFWYWNTLKNRVIDSTLVGITEDEMMPGFFGGTGKMEVFYGERKTFQFFDEDNRPVAYQTITLTTGDGDITQTEQTDANGKAGFDILSTRYFKFGNSLENDGITGTPDRTDYERRYTFSAGAGIIPIH
jgi:hypothetical protein